MKPNLFHFATSELSQDAFICWLLSWADPKCEANDASLHRLAVVFLGKLLRAFGKKDLQLNTITLDSSR